jgi:hypothetical protein
MSNKRRKSYQQSSMELATLAVIALLTAGTDVAYAQRADPQIVARSGDYVFTEQNLEDIRTVDACVLDSPLNPAEEQDASENILGQFRSNPEAFVRSMPDTHRYAEILRHGSQTERLMLSSVLWGRWMGATGDPSVAIWVAMVKRHSPPVARDGNLLVTNRQLTAMFASNDWVAQAAGLPTSTPESRAAYAKKLAVGFASMSPQEKQQLAFADQRWVALQSPILDHTDLRAKAISLAKQHVHGPGDVAPEARSLENDGLEFHAEMQQFAEHMAQIGGVGYLGKTQADGINFATRKFMGQGR